MKVFTFYWDERKIEFSFPEHPSEMEPERLLNIIEALSQLEKKGFDDQESNINYAAAWLNCSKDELLNYADSNIYWEFRSGTQFDWFFDYLKAIEKLSPPDQFQLGDQVFNIPDLGKIIPYKIIMEMELALKKEGGLMQNALRLISICLRVTEGMKDPAKIENKISETIDLLKKEKADEIYSIANFFLRKAGFYGRPSARFNYLKTLKLILLNQKILKNTAQPD
jgi:hypothetical protein